MKALLRRLRNLWILSAYEPLKQGYKLSTGEVLIPRIEPLEQAQVIIKKKTLDDLVDELNG